MLRKGKFRASFYSSIIDALLTFWGLQNSLSAQVAAGVVALRECIQLIASL